MTALLELRGVRAGYGRIEVLRGLTLAVPEGGVAALLGPNGTGKSTTIRAVAGLLPVAAGEIRLAGRRIDGRPSHRIARMGVGVVPEGRGVFPGLTVAENLEIGARAAGSRGAAGRAATVDEMLDLFPALAVRLPQAAATLSGGEQQMLALARALCGRPRLLLLDEVSAGLAPAVVRQLMGVIDGARRQGATVLVAEQFAEYVLDLADVCYVLARGTVVHVVEAAEIRHRPELLLGAAAGEYRPAP